MLQVTFVSQRQAVSKLYQSVPLAVWYLISSKHVLDECAFSPLTNRIELSAALLDHDTVRMQSVQWF